MGKGEIGGHMANPEDCEKELADYLAKSFGMLKQCFEDAKLKDFEERAKGLSAKLDSCRTRAAKARGYSEAESATAPLEKELDAFEAAFEKWYDEEADDQSFFARVASLFLDIRLHLETYRGGAGTLGEAGGNLEKAKEECGRLNEEFKSHVQKFDSLAQQVAAKAGTDSEKQRAERITDMTSTMLRYLDINHEMLMTELLGPAGKEGALEKALRMTGSAQGEVSGLRSNAYHLNDEAMQEAAASASFSFFAYRGALCAAFAIQGGK